MNFCTLLAVFAVIGSSVSFRLDSSADNINSDRIINGSFASPGQFPYMVSVRRNGFGDTEWRRHICGGSLISNRWVISAARCVHQSFVRQYWIAVGAHHLFSDGAAYRVSRVVNHPGFSGTPLLRNDISLIQTDAPIHFTDRIRPIPLSRQFVGAGVASIASGWGLNRNISSVRNKPNAFIPTKGRISELIYFLLNSSPIDLSPRTCNFYAKPLSQMKSVVDSTDRHNWQLSITRHFVLSHEDSKACANTISVIHWLQTDN